MSEVAAPAVHVVVLAAGRGSRLGALGGETPKWLLPVGGRLIADRHLEGVAAVGGQVASVRVVTGHAASAIEAFLAEREAAPAIAVVENPDFEDLNNWWSLLLALRDLPEEGPVVVLNGDLLTDPAWVSDFIADVLAGTEEGVLAVDTQRRLTDESMKVALGPDGRLARIGKVDVVPNPDFEALNNWWSLLLALRELPEDGPVVVVNGDLLTHPDWLSGFLADAAAGPHDGLLAVDTQRRLTDESMKVALAPDGALAGIGKVGVTDPVGEYVGILAARGPVLRALRARLEEFVGRPEAANEWYEGAIGRTAADGVLWHIWATPGSGWVEIDDDDDLSTAQALAGP